MTSRFHITIAQMSLPLVVIYFASSIGSVFGGWLSGYLDQAWTLGQLQPESRDDCLRGRRSAGHFCRPGSDPVDVRFADFYCRRRPPGIFVQPVLHPLRYVPRPIRRHRRGHRRNCGSSGRNCLCRPWPDMFSTALTTIPCCLRFADLCISSRSSCSRCWCLISSIRTAAQKIRREIASNCRTQASDSRVILSNSESPAISGYRRK